MRTPRWLMELDAQLTWMRFLLEAEAAPGHESSSPFVIRCVAALAFGKDKSSKASPRPEFLANPRAALDKYFGICVDKEQKGAAQGKDYSTGKGTKRKGALDRPGYKGREAQYNALLAMAREQTAKKREAAGQEPYGPSKGKKTTKWKKGPAAAIMSKLMDDRDISQELKALDRRQKDRFFRQIDKMGLGSRKRLTYKLRNKIRGIIQDIAENS